MNGVSVSLRNSYIGIKNARKNVEFGESWRDVIAAVLRSALHDYIVLGLYNALYTGFVWNFTRSLTNSVANYGQKLNAIQMIVFVWWAKSTIYWDSPRIAWV